MSRYGWPSYSYEQVSPYTSLSGGIPSVTDEDFSYITSQDLEGDVSGGRHYPYPRSHSAAPPAPEDDVLLIKNKGINYPTHFPAYSIGDGKVQVRDVRNRVGIMLELSDRLTRRIKLHYKGRYLKDTSAPIREYGVKNNSELLAVVHEADGASSPSEEEMIVVEPPRKTSKSKSKGNKGKGKKKTKKPPADDVSSFEASSARDSTSTLGTPRSPPAPAFTPLATSPPAPMPSFSPKSISVAGPMKQLYDIFTDFSNKWLPMCNEYIASPPADPKKREEEHRRLSETVMMHTILKLDGVDIEGKPEVRARRKELVKYVQSTLKGLDIAKES